MQSPWIEYYDQVEAMFRKDPDVKVAYEDDEKTLTLYVKGSAKAEALTRVLPGEKTFGNVTLKVRVLPANEEKTMADILRDAFFGNAAVVDIHTNPGPFLEGLNYVIFRAEVVQYFSDNLHDANGLSSTLYQDLADAVFEDIPGIAYCTEPVSFELRKPLGEWP